jgi:hypothetical protein
MPPAATFRIVILVGPETLEPDERGPTTLAGKTTRAYVWFWA